MLFLVTQWNNPDPIRARLHFKSQRLSRTYTGEGGLIAPPFLETRGIQRVVSRVVKPTRPRRCARKASGLNLRVLGAYVREGDPFSPLALPSSYSPRLGRRPGCFCFMGEDVLAPSLPIGGWRPKLSTDWGGGQAAWPRLRASVEVRLPRRRSLAW